jgi:hypothetical protein
MDRSRVKTKQIRAGFDPKHRYLETKNEIGKLVQSSILYNYGTVPNKTDRYGFLIIMEEIKNKNR